MSPVICFYQNQLISSKNYTRLIQNKNETTKEFLSRVEKNFFNELKVLQVDFEAFGSENINKSKFYVTPKAQVFVLHDHHDFSSIENSIEPPQFQCGFAKNEFCALVKKIITDINEGRFYQVNLTSFFKATTNAKAIDLFQTYLRLFQAHYSAFLPSDEFSILSFSPELFLKKSGSKLVTQPIKGTGVDFYELLKNQKEAAELSMIVDLLRNDLHSVATSATKVVSHRQKLQLPYTIHTYSEIEVQTDQTLPSILENMMPGGSISGCPKIESLKAIEQYENYQRQFYTGTIGWWMQNDFELNIAIRSFVQKQNELYYFAGCGIVAESDPEAEWKELLNKAGKLKLINTDS